MMGGGRVWNRGLAGSLVVHLEMAGLGQGITKILTLCLARPSGPANMGGGRVGRSGEQVLSLTSPRPCALVTAPCTRTSLGSWWCMSSSPVSSRRSVMR